jgi:hypothetical protein
MKLRNFMINKMDNIQKYKEFYGKNTDKMPKLIAEGRTPLSVAGLERVRVEEDLFCDIYVDTGDGILDHPDGRAKIVLDAQPLRELTPESKLIKGALVIPSYEEINGLELSKKELKKYANGKWLKKKEALDNKVHRILARHPDEVPKEIAEDKNLLKECVDRVYSYVKERFDSDVAMAVYKASPMDVPTMRLWCVGSFSNRSNAYGDDVHLDFDVGRLIGVAPEAQSDAQKLVARPTLDQITKLTDKYVAEINREDLQAELKKLYK